MNRQGRFIVIEGPDGVGKDTVIARLENWLLEQGRDFVLVKDPSPEVAQPIREALLTSPDLEESTRLFLYLAARSELLHKQIAPAYRAGKVVLSNRYMLSTLAYQGGAFSRKDIEAISRMGGLNAVVPDLQVVLLSRRSFRDLAEEDAMGVYCDSNRERILNAYEALAHDPGLRAKALWVDGLGEEAVFEEVRAQLASIL